MAQATTPARSPRGTKFLTQAFFSAAGEIPEAQRAAVVKAALTAIRDQMKASREKATLAKAKAKGKTAAAPKQPMKKLGRPKGTKNKVEAAAPIAVKAKKVEAKPAKVVAKLKEKATPKTAEKKPAPVMQTTAE
jgi:hypothetical protein